MIYRMDIISNSNGYRVLLTADDGNAVETIHSAKSPTAPRAAQLRAFLANKGFVAYGDSRTIGDRILRTMIRPV